jgi:hypothetical protein
MVGTKKFYFATAGVRLSLPAQRHTVPDGNRHPDRNLASTSYHRSHRLWTYHCLACIQALAGYGTMVRKKRSGL